MAVSSRAENFFQTSASIEDNERKQRKSANTFGDPVKFPSKILSLQVNKFLDPSGNTACVTEAGGLLSSIDIRENTVTRIGKGATAPLTCLACYGEPVIAGNSTSSQVIFVGGWDKSISKIIIGEDPTTHQIVHEQASFTAHSDFVKCLLIARTADKELILISGGADGDVQIWSFNGVKLTTIRPQCRGIECLALDPFSTPEEPRVFFSTSQREIFTFTIPALDALRSGKVLLSSPIIQHETSVYKLAFDNDGDLWTASADKTSKRLSRENNFIADTTLVHPDFVRDVVVQESTGLVITACRDEEIRVWNAGTSQIMHIFTGHFEEVTGLDFSGDLLISVSIDATLRRWSLKPEDLKKAIDEAKNPQLLVDVPEPTTDLGMLTAEEEAELRALMEDEEEATLEKMAMDEQ